MKRGTLMLICDSDKAKMNLRNQNDKVINNFIYDIEKENLRETTI